MKKAGVFETRQHGALPLAKSPGKPSGMLSDPDWIEEMHVFPVIYSVQGAQAVACL
jgi:hypothetical protein